MPRSANEIGKWNLALFLDAISTSDGGSSFNFEYHKKHEPRFLKTQRLMDGLTGDRAIEIGATDFFQMSLKYNNGFGEVWGTIFSDNPEQKLYQRSVRYGDFDVTSNVVSIDIERELFPVSREYFDLILFCEVLEHLDIDPMFSLSEFNRILRPGGKIVLTTPNCCSARNLWKIMHGYRPHFFMQYEKSRSPYRHNFEHDVHSVSLLLTSAGFRVDILETKDVFESPVQESLEFIRKHRLEANHRGDDIFVIATKVGAISDRWPEQIYV